ncbi:MAG TPA: AsmA-like C-terminal region-containing protein [Myxococcaceae bacterium]|nr:AsmA-like C-terminal region-containing protein [Myxococcaceae bacterium]
MASPFQKRWVRVLAIVVAVLVAVVLVLSLVLDSLLTRRAQAEAAMLSQQLGRPVSVGRVSTSFLTGLGATVSGIEVGAAADEGVPLAQAKGVGIKVAALRALFSLGKDIVVRSVEVTQPVLNVVRLPDGSTNLERLQSRLTEQGRTKPSEPTSNEPKDLSAVRIDHAEVTDGRVRLVDRSTGQTRELGISDLDITVDDLRAGKPLDVVVKAALLTEKQNLELRLHTAPLPNTLQPTPERVVVKIQPVDLAPLGPFLPRDARLESGRLDADWTAELGAAVPGGKGPTQAKGGIHARGLRFAGTGASPVDLTVDTDLNGDVETGDLDIRTLAIALGQAGINGHGRVRNLASETPSIEGFEIVGHNLDPAVMARSFPALAKALKGQAAGPIGLTIRGAGTQAAPTLDLTLDFTPVRLAIPEQLTKAAGAPMTAVTHLQGAGKATYRFHADLDFAGADLRPGQLLDKPPGKPMALSLEGSASRGATTRVKLEQWTLRVLEDTVTGTASVELQGEGKRATTTFALDARAPKLDADALLLQTEGSRAQPPPADPHRFDGLRGKIHAEVASLVFHKVPWRSLLLDASMQDDLVKVDRFSMDAAGGQVRLDGTSARLGPVDKSWDLQLAVKGLDLAQTLTFGGRGKAFAGVFDGNIALAGKGTTLAAVEKTLDGKIQGNLRNGAFLGADLVSAVAGPLAKALPFATKALGETGRTPLGDDLGVALTVDNGVAKLAKPFTVQLPQAGITLGGGIGLSGTLALAGTVALTPATIKTLTGGRVTPPEPIPVALSLSGPAWAPQISGLDVTPAALTIARLAGASTLKSLFGQSDIGKAAAGALGGSGPAGTEQTQGEQKAQSEAEKLRQEAAEEARKRLQGLFGK